MNLQGRSTTDPEAVHLHWSPTANRKDHLLLYLQELHQLCWNHGLNFDALVVQSMHETATYGNPWTSFWWTSRLNPAGIGITGDEAQDEASRYFITGTSSARAHFIHMWLYVNGATLPAGLDPREDPRWDAAIRAGRARIATTTDDLAGTWAADPEYGTKIDSWETRYNASWVRGTDCDVSSYYAPI